MPARVFCILLFYTLAPTFLSASEIRVAASESIQAIIDANPGQSIRLDADEYKINAPIIISHDNTTLHGTATIIQTNPDASIIEIKSSTGVTLDGLTLTRRHSSSATGHGVYVINAKHFRLSDLTVIDNRSSGAAILIDAGQQGSISSCEIINYKRIGIDDRTSNEQYGYAFRAIVGDGIGVKNSRRISITNNQIYENNVRSDAGAKKQFDLGRITRTIGPENRKKFAPPGNYVSNWHQGSAVVATDPESTSHILVSDNIIRNAAQGIDIHADRVTVSSNIIDHAFIGIKVMHGSRNVIVSNNNVSHTDLWGIVMLPGSAAHEFKTNSSGEPRPPNVTRGNIIAGNIFTDFGYGHDYHNWRGSTSRNVLQFEVGDDRKSPPLRDILVTGNIVYDPGLDGHMPDSQPRYDYAVFVDPKLKSGAISFRNNIFHTGTKGISNVELDEY